MRSSFDLPWALALAIPIVCILFWPGCSSSERGIDGTDESGDVIAPAAIQDLRVIEMTPTGVLLLWTATGDDAHLGKATEYSVRYSLSEINVDNFASAAEVASVPFPSFPDSTDSVRVTGLAADTLYHFAVKAADEAGNWSAISNTAQAICFDNFEISIPDSMLERILRSRVARPTGPIRRFDLLGVLTIAAQNQRIESLQGIQYCRHLESLNLWNNSVSDLSPLSNLTSLRTLNIGYNGLSDISQLGALTGLETLHVSANAIEDISALSSMSKLVELNLVANRIWIISSLAGKVNLKRLYLDENQIVYVNALYNVTGLDVLSLGGNLISDITPLLFNAGLTTGDTLNLASNPLSTQTVDSLIPVLEGRGVIVLH